MSKIWSKDEVEFLRENYLKMNDEKIAEKLGNKTEQQVKFKRGHEKLNKNNIKEIRQCKFCKNNFEVIISANATKDKQFCSQECYIKSRNGGKTRVKCAECGKEIDVQNSRIKEHNFCDRHCLGKYMGKLNGQKTFNRIKKICKNCEEEYEVKNYLKDTSNFCSSKCQGEWRSKNILGESHPSYSQISYSCDWCGIEFKDKKYKTKQKSNFCCKECKDEYHKNVFVKTDEFKDKMRRVMINNLDSGLIHKTNSHPQILINNILDNLNIKYENEYNCNYYAIDNYLSEYNLFIEVMGTYWHCDNRKYNKVKDETQYKIIIRDRTKSTYIKNKYKINILYLWEYDIENDPLLCEKLILLYIKNNGILDNYHSFNYFIDNEDIYLNEDFITPYMNYDINSLKNIIDTGIIKKPDKYIDFECDCCRKSVTRLISEYKRQRHHFCSRECAVEFLYHKNN